jgi:hypothetical protein
MPHAEMGHEAMPGCSYLILTSILHDTPFRSVNSTVHFLSMRDFDRSLRAMIYYTINPLPTSFSNHIGIRRVVN